MWLLSAAMVLSLHLFLITYLILNNAPFHITFLQLIPYTFVFILYIIISARALRLAAKQERLIDDQLTGPNIFSSLQRPQKVTEEEVSVSKERKICLVCKGGGMRYSYICPECNAIYCVKCANSLSNMENACWVCETPFDESKPVKASQKEDECSEIPAEVSHK